MNLKVDYSMFKRQFEYMGRLTQFPTGLRALYNHILELEEGSGTDFELDVIALCCDYTESTLKEALDYYNLDSLDELRDNTIVIMVDEDEEDEDTTVIYLDY